MKVEVKNIDYVWHAFMPDAVLKSAGIVEIVDMVNDAWPPVEKGYEVRWEAKSNKFVVREVESKSRKISKTDQ